MIKPNAILVATGLAVLSALMLLAAAFFEHVMGLLPCIMCLWQRWAHWLVVGIGGMAFLLGKKAGLQPGRGILLMLVAIVACLIAGAGIGFWHAGVEAGLLTGPSACSGIDLGGEAGAALDRLLATPSVRCDEVAWSLLGISMAGWNGIISLLMASIGVISVVSNFRNRQQTKM